MKPQADYDDVQLFRIALRAGREGLTAIGPEDTAELVRRVAALKRATHRELLAECEGAYMRLRAMARKRKASAFDLYGGLVFAEAAMKRAL